MYNVCLVQIAGRQKCSCKISRVKFIPQMFSAGCYWLHVTSVQALEQNLSNWRLLPSVLGLGGTVLARPEMNRNLSHGKNYISFVLVNCYLCKTITN